MSLITQCPACNTMFKVVADQLKVSQGWVRCGQCKEVFDANTHLTRSQSLHPEPELVSRSEVVIQDVKPSSSTSFAQPFGGKPDFASSDWVNTVNPPSPLNPAANQGLSNELEGKALDAANFDRQLAQDLPISLIKKPPAPPSFVRQAQRTQSWKTPWIRAGLGLFALLLVALATLQVAVHERDRVVATHPGAHGIMAELCRRVGCAIRPLRQIDAIVVDASSFNKIRSDSKIELYKVTLNLKNNGALAVALPHIELSLNDTQDQTIVRRVLNPADIGAVQFVISARGEFNGSAVVQIDTAQLGGVRVAGYRIWAFYPS